MSLTDFNTGRGLSEDINNLILAATRETKFRGVSVSHCIFFSISYNVETFSAAFSHFMKPQLSLETLGGAN